MIRIFTDKKEKDLKNFWNHIVFHPTDAIEDDWGKRILDKCAEDKAVKTVRIYTMMEDIFTLDENGEMHADYTLNDYRIDYLLLPRSEAVVAEVLLQYLVFIHKAKAPLNLFEYDFSHSVL